MKPWLAILFTLALLALCLLIPSAFQAQGTWLMILATSLWAAIDSSRIQLRRYKSGISSSPIVLFVGCALLWIVGFPWYLIMRQKIKAGTATLKDQAAQPNAAASLSGPA
jgi:hypothetical protein